MTRGELRIHLAAALAGVDGIWEVADERHFRLVDAMLAELDSRGLRVVPVLPTMAMLAAGQDAWLKDPTRRSSVLWKAMVNAQPI